MYGIDNLSKSLYKNLKTIALCKLNNLKEALNEVEQIASININKFANEGCLYPLTVIILIN
jgi:hypothetical protein